MDIEDLVVQMGGVASRGALLRRATRADIDQAIASGTLVVVARGRYAVRGVDAAVEAAHRLSGVLPRESAALHHGWAVKTVPPEPHVSVPRGRKVASGRAAGVCLHRDDLHADDVQGIATSKEYTLTQCLRLLSWDAQVWIGDARPDLVAGRTHVRCCCSCHA